MWSGAGGSEQWWSAGMERRRAEWAISAAGCTGAGREVGAGGVPHLLGVRGFTVYSETSREEQVSPAPRSGRCGRRTHLSLARRRRRSPPFAPRRPLAWRCDSASGSRAHLWRGQAAMAYSTVQRVALASGVVLAVSLLLPKVFLSRGKRPEPAPAPGGKRGPAPQERPASPLPVGMG